MTSVRSMVVVTVAPVHLTALDVDGLDDAERSRVVEASSSWVAASRVAGYRLVRDVLADVLDMNPSAVRLDRRCPTCGRPHGRIRVLDDSHLWVSVSRAGRPPGPKTPDGVGPPVVAVAVTRLAPMGVDLTWEGDPTFAGFDDVARHPDDTGLDAAVLWVRKEAAVKAIGTGLTIDPTTFPAPIPGQVGHLGPDGAPVAVADVAPLWLSTVVTGGTAVRRLVGAVALSRADPAVPVHLTQRHRG